MNHAHEDRPPVVRDLDAARVLRAEQASLRAQLAVVRSLLDELEHQGARMLASHEGLRDQLVEEVTRLACRLLESAAAVAKSGD